MPCCGCEGPKVAIITPLPEEIRNLIAQNALPAAGRACAHQCPICQQSVAAAQPVAASTPQHAAVGTPQPRSLRCIDAPQETSGVQTTQNRIPSFSRERPPSGVFQSLYTETITPPFRRATPRSPRDPNRPDFSIDSLPSSVPMAYTPRGAPMYGKTLGLSPRPVTPDGLSQQRMAHREPRNKFESTSIGGQQSLRRSPAPSCPARSRGEPFQIYESQPSPQTRSNAMRQRHAELSRHARDTLSPLLGPSWYEMMARHANNANNTASSGLGSTLPPLQPANGPRDHLNFLNWDISPIPHPPNYETRLGQAGTDTWGSSRQPSYPIDNMHPLRRAENVVLCCGDDEEENSMIEKSTEENVIEHMPDGRIRQRISSTSMNYPKPEQKSQGSCCRTI